MNTRFFHVVKIAGKMIGLSVAGLALLGLLIGLFYGYEIKRMVISQVNKNLVAEIVVKDFDFSVFRHFPYAAVDLNQVMIREVTKQKSLDTLLYADKISLLFNITEVFNKDITIKKILAQDGKINIRINALGENNYHFWKTADDSTASSALNLQKILLKNISLTYFDLHNHQDYRCQVNDAGLSGQFANESFTLNTTADLFVEHLITHNVNYIDHKPVKLKTGILCNNHTGHYSFGKSTIGIANLVFQVNGFLDATDLATSLDLSVNSNEASIASFMSVLPASLTNPIAEFKSKGMFIFSSRINGEVGRDKNPRVEIKFAVKDGELKTKESDFPLEKLNLSGTFLSGVAGKKSELIIPTLTASFGGRKVSGDLRVYDLENPFLTLHAVADLDLAQVRHFVRKDTLSSLEGELSFDISFAGKVKDLPRENSEDLYKVKASGKIEVRNVSFMLKHNPLQFRNFNGSFSLHDNDILVNSLEGNVSSSDMKVHGTFRNFINFLLIPNQPAEIDAALTSELINLDELLANKTDVIDDTSYLMKFNPRLISDLDVRIGKLNFRKFHPTSLRGKVHLEKQVISGKDLAFAAMDGGVVMDAMINASRRDSIQMRCDATVNRLDINQLFSQMENFGQSTMTDQNVRGRISAEVVFSSMWSNSLVINSSTARATSNITIENGELINFKPIMPLAKYIRLADLNHIRFSTLKNQVSIANRKINIPSMEIKSSALNLTASGVHNFDNIVDYHLKLLLSDVLGKKMKQNSTEFGEIEDDGLGRTQLMLTMKGPVDNPKFSWDKKEAGEKLRADIGREKQNFKKIMNEEFGLFKKDIPSAEKPKKKDELQVDWTNDDKE